MRAISPNATKTIKVPFDPEGRAEVDIAVALLYPDRVELLDAAHEIAQNREDGQNTPSELYSFFRLCAKKGLRAVRGVYDLEGKEIEVENSTPSDEVLAKLQEVRVNFTDVDNLVNWIGMQVWAANQLSAEEKKTSAGPSGSGNI